MQESFDAASLTPTMSYSGLTDVVEYLRQWGAGLAVSTFAGGKLQLRAPHMTRIGSP